MHAGPHGFGGPGSHDGGPGHSVRGGLNWLNTGTIHFQIGPFSFGGGHHDGGSGHHGEHPTGSQARGRQSAPQPGMQPSGIGFRGGFGGYDALSTPGGGRGRGFSRGEGRESEMGERFRNFVEQSERRSEDRPQRGSPPDRMLRQQIQDLQRQQQQMSEALQKIARQLEELQKK
jgi:hypothetical protein